MPEEGVEPSLLAASAKYSALSGRDSGDGVIGGAIAMLSDDGDTTERSELVRAPAGRSPCLGDTGCGGGGVLTIFGRGGSCPPLGEKNEPLWLLAGVAGEVAIGRKGSSTLGFVAAV